MGVYDLRVLRAEGGAGTVTKVFRLSLVLTYRCNMKCTYCYVKLATQDTMPRAIGEAGLALALERLGGEGILDLGFFGGEPLLELSGLVDLTELARERAAAQGVRVIAKVTTNGTMLAPAVVERLRRADVDLTVSYDGVAEAHDAGRPFVSGGGSHAAVVEGLRCAVNAGVPVTVNMVVDPVNVAHLARGVDEVLSLGARRVVLSVNHDARWRQPAMEKMEEQYGLIGERWLAEARQGRALSLSFLDEKLDRAASGRAHVREVCSFGLSELAVDPRGRLFPCERLVRDAGGDEWTIGRLPGGVDPARLAAVRGPLDEEPEDCRRCALNSVCTNFCACMNISRTGKVNEPDGLVCFLESLTTRITRRVAAEVVRWKTSESPRS